MNHMKNIRRIIAVLACTVFVMSLCAGCKKDEPGVTKLPVATPNPNITHPEGKYYEAEGALKAEGGLKVLGADFMKVMIEGKEEEFALSEHAQWEISQYNKDPENPRICIGTMLLVTYEVKNLVKVVETMDIITAN